MLATILSSISKIDLRSGTDVQVSICHHGLQTDTDLQVQADIESGWSLTLRSSEYFTNVNSATQPGVEVQELREKMRTLEQKLHMQEAARMALEVQLPSLCAHSRFSQPNLQRIAWTTWLVSTKRKWHSCFSLSKGRPVLAFALHTDLDLIQQAISLLSSQCVL